MEAQEFEYLTGRTEVHLKSITINNYSFFINPKIEPDLMRWESDCIKHGIDFAVASAFRSYERQLLIWNEKVEGKRPLKDKSGVTIEASKLTDQALLNTIMLWTHIPGVSRHHWGTDLDVFDATWYKKNNEKLLLENTIFEEGGACHKFHQLNESLLDNPQSMFAFYRPYNDGKSFMKELWHYSHKKTAKEFEKKFSYELFIQNIEESKDLLLRDLILDNAMAIYSKYISLG